LGVIAGKFHHEGRQPALTGKLEPVHQAAYRALEAEGGASAREMQFAAAALRAAPEALQSAKSSIALHPGMRYKRPFRHHSFGPPASGANALTEWRQLGGTFGAEPSPYSAAMDAALREDDREQIIKNAQAGYLNR
jgi:hypothetical protein